VRACTGNKTKTKSVAVVIGVQFCKCRFGKLYRRSAKRLKHDRVAGCLAKLTATPYNAVATLQQETPVVLSCKTDKSGTPLTWFFGSITNVIHGGYGGKEKYPVTTDLEAGESNITLSRLDAFDHAGLYICMEPGTNQQASAQLAILGKFNLFLLPHTIRYDI